jgi:hypothetical protein
MKPTQALVPVLLGLLSAAPAAWAQDAAAKTSARLGEHPAVLVARRGVQPDPQANFYLHPARLEWSLQRPLEPGEHPAVLVAHHEADFRIDPNRFILAHPAGGAPTN